jgi:hypothetical protein
MSDHKASEKTVTRPLPRLNELDTGAFLAATKDKQFTYQQCEKNEKVIWHPRSHSTGSVNGENVTKISKGEGAIYSFSVVRLSYHPFFKTKAPYVVAYVDLDEGPRFLTNVVGIENPLEDVHIGQRVKIDWEEHEELCIPLVRPID